MQSSAFTMHEVTCKMRETTLKMLEVTLKIPQNALVTTVQDTHSPCLPPPPAARPPAVAASHCSCVAYSCLRALLSAGWAAHEGTPRTGQENDFLHKTLKKELHCRGGHEKKKNWRGGGTA